MQPETRYAPSPEGAVAYQVFGEGPLDLVFVGDWMSNVEIMWEEPRIERYLRRLASFARVVVFDKRGTGLSDPVPLGALPTLEQWSDDIRTVMDAVGTEHAALHSHGSGSVLALPFAAIHPSRVSALVVAGGYVRGRRAPDFPYGVPDEAVEQVIGFVAKTYGTDSLVPLIAPSLAGDASFRRWQARSWRHSISPGAWEQMFRFGLDVDIRSVLGSIQAPTLVLHRADDRWFVPGHGRYIAEHIVGAKYVELPGADNSFWAGNQDELLDEIQAFLTGARGMPEIDRVLSTVLFTDIVASTKRAAELGDRRWRDLLDEHDRMAITHVDRFRGRLVKSTGDGVLATFDGPARAIRCARALAEGLEGLGLAIKAGLHTGEVELRGEDIGGIAVNLASRVMTNADPGEILVSSTVEDLVVGSGITFEDRGITELKGIPGRWRLAAVRSV